LDARIWGAQPFAAAACRPADTRIGNAAERGIVIRQGWSILNDLRDTGARIRLTIRQTAGSVDKQSRGNRKAQPAAHGAEVISSRAGRQVLIKQNGDDRSLAKHKVCAVAG